MARSGKGLVSVFQGSSAGIGEAFILVGGTGRWTGILWDLGTFLVFPNLLRSSS